MNVLENAFSATDAVRLARQPRSTRLALEMLDRIEGGALAIALPDGQRVRVGNGALVAKMRVHDHAVFASSLAQGDIGFSETWMEGLWESDDLAALLTLLASNRTVLEKAVYGRMFRLIGHRLTHLLRANTRSGSRRNIEAHYDLGNAFYKLWLDPSMTYSAAVFSGPDDSLQEAQARKYRRILTKIGAKPGQTILEIGCGWGGFAEVAAREFDCKVLGLTLSPSQLAYARERAVRCGFADQVAFELCDYRDVRGQYDHVVSIEMIEAVGERFWPTYFAQLCARLKPTGRCAVQAITIADGLFPRYRRGTDFIQRHIFPGGMLPSPSKVAQLAAAANLDLIGDFAFAADYSRTLKCWSDQFEARLPEVRAQGFDERFVRMWRFYLAYCQAGLNSGDVDVHHYLFAHAGSGAG